jgi:prepilin-type processing-associated H-X9-DG protein
LVLRNGWSTTWVISILPQLEQQASYDRFDPTIPMGMGNAASTANQRIVTGTPLAIFKCSSDARMGPLIDPDGVIGTFDRGNYAINLGGGTASENGGNGAGPEESPAWALNPAPNGYGQRSKNRGLSHHRDGAARQLPTTTGLEDILDGTSNTLLVGEILKRNHTADSRGAWGRAWSCIISAYTHGLPDTDLINGIATPNVRAVGIYRDGPPHCDNSGTVGDPQLECTEGSDDTRGGMVMRSRHPGGVQASFCDGRVTFISNTVNKLTYRAMFTIQGNETIGDF